MQVISIVFQINKKGYVSKLKFVIALNMAIKIKYIVK